MQTEPRNPILFLDVACDVCLVLSGAHSTASFVIRHNQHKTVNVNVCVRHKTWAAGKTGDDFAALAAQAKPMRTPQPKRMRSHTFNPSHLYMHEERGVVSCGAHVGIEATYTPTAWLDMGECDGYMVGGSDHVFRCETPHGKVAVA